MKTTFAPAALLFAATLLQPAGAWAWGRDGHETVGYLAATLIAGTNAERGVASILHSDETLATAAEWPDCAKGYKYCHVAPTAEMVAFSKRNPAHHRYHYTDVAFQLTSYAESLPGTDHDDIVHILADAIRVLKGQPPSDPGHSLTQREALFVLAHMVGDIHQPLHVGAAYIDATDHYIVPNDVNEASAAATQGGNWVCVGSKNLHAIWDGGVVAKAMKAAGVTSSQDFAATLRPRALDVNVDTGEATNWPTQWATETIQISKQALSTPVVTGRREQGATSPCQISGPRGVGVVWDIKLPRGYVAEGAVTAREQLTRAGARLASVFRAIWP
jgi:hypothetical protein